MCTSPNESHGQASKGAFVVIPRPLIDDPRFWTMLDSDRRVLLALYAHRNLKRNLAYPSQVTIAAMTHLSRRTVQVARLRLEAAGMIRTRRGVPGLGRSGSGLTAYTFPHRKCAPHAAPSSDDGGAAQASQPTLDDGADSDVECADSMNECAGMCVECADHAAPKQLNRRNNLNNGSASLAARAASLRATLVAAGVVGERTLDEFVDKSTVTLERIEAVTVYAKAHGLGPGWVVTALRDDSALPAEVPDSGGHGVDAAEATRRRLRESMARRSNADHYRDIWNAADEAQKQALADRFHDGTGLAKEDPLRGLDRSMLRTPNCRLAVERLLQRIGEENAAGQTARELMS